MTKTDSYANYCVTTEETGDNTATTEIVAEADSQSTVGDQSTTSSTNYSSMEYQCVDSEKTFDKSIERSSSFKPMTLSQEILLEDEAERDRNRTVTTKPLTLSQKIILKAEEERDRNRTLITYGKVKSDMQRRYCLELPSVGGVTSATPYHRNLNVIKSRSTATSTSTEWRQSAAISATASQMEFQRFDRFDAKKTIDELTEQALSPILKTLSNGPLIPTLSELLNYKNSTKGSTKVIDSPQPSSKECTSVELNGNSDGASRKDLFCLQEHQPTTTPDKNYETYLSHKELASEASSVFCVTDNRKAPDDSKSTISGKESIVADQNSEIMNSTAAIETQVQMHPVESIHPKLCESIGERQTLPPQSPKECDRSNVNTPDRWDHSYCQPIKDGPPEYSPVKLIHPTTNIGSESIEVKNDSTSQLSPVTFIGLESHTEFVRSNISIPASTQSDALNEILITVPTQSYYSYNKSNDVESAAPQFSPEVSVIPPRAGLSLKQQNFVQPPNAVKPTTSKVNSSAKTRKRPYSRSNKIIIESDELIKMPLPPPPVGSIIRTLPNSAVGINQNQIIYDQQPPNLPKRARPIQRADMQIPMKNAAKSNSATTAKSVKRKNTEKVPVHVPIQAKYPMKPEPKSSPTATITTSLKRKNKENLSLHVPAKVQKMDIPIQGTMTNIATNSISVNLPDITIERVKMVQKDKKSATVTSLENRSFSDCVKFLECNNVTIFKVPQNPQPVKGPQNPQPSNKVLDKYLKVLQQNGIRVERVSKSVNLNGA